MKDIIPGIEKNIIDNYQYTHQIKPKYQAKMFSTRTHIL